MFQNPGFTYSLGRDNVHAYTTVKSTKIIGNPIFIIYTSNNILCVSFIVTGLVFSSYYSQKQPNELNLYLLFI